ncbi:hypothetical protein ACXDIL_000595 [Klebsiella pneumoniae]
MAYTSRLLNAIPGIRHAFLDVHETAAFPYAELAPVKLVHGNEVHHYQQPLPTRPHADAVFTAVAGQKAGVAPASVEWLGSCTYCTPQSLGSYRRRTHFPAPKSFQYSWIMREA